MELLKKEKFNAVRGLTYYYPAFSADYSEHTIKEYVTTENEQLLKCLYFNKKEDITPEVISELKKEFVELESSLTTLFGAVSKKIKTVEETTVKVLDNVETGMLNFSQKYEDQARD